MKDDDSKFWLGLWKIVCISICVFTATISGCVLKQNSQVITAINAGADPIAASCAIKGVGTYEQIMCSEAGK